jgi:hypothetical protein
MSPSIDILVSSNLVISNTVFIRFGLVCLGEQGCQIFLAATDQNGEKYTK